MAGIALLLLTAVGGYLVLERSAKQKGNLRKLGNFIGYVVVIVSLLGVLCGIVCCATGNGAKCSMFSKGKYGWYCPLKAKSKGITPAIVPADK